MAQQVGDFVDITVPELRLADGSTLEDVTISGHVVSIDAAVGTTTIAMTGDINGQSTFTVPDDQVRAVH